MVIDWYEEETKLLFLCLTSWFENFQVCTSEDSCRYARISELFVYEKFSRTPAESVEAGDICAVCGIEDIQASAYKFFMD